MGVNACSGGRQYLYALAGAGYAGVDRATSLLRGEMERSMLLMGCRSVREFRPSMLARRPG
jgi:L-lactate dehydrogenase (cytochrome)